MDAYSNFAVNDQADWCRVFFFFAFQKGVKDLSAILSVLMLIDVDITYQNALCIVVFFPFCHVLNAVEK